MSDLVSRAHLDGRNIIIESIQDVEPYLEFNKDVRNSSGGRSEWGRLIGLIPNVVIERWIVEDGVNYCALGQEEFSRLVRRKLRDPDYAWLRTTDGQI